MVEWAGNWNNFDLDCGDGQPVMYYNRRGQPVTCLYQTEGPFPVHAALYYQNTAKATADTILEALPPYALYLPMARRGK